MLVISQSAQAYIYAIFVISVFIGLAVYVYYLFGDKSRGRRIEKRGQIIFHDEPLEDINDSWHKIQGNNK